jgi:DNA adenine methylase
MEPSVSYNTPLRYPGGKGKLTDFIKLVFKGNNLLDGHYAEPYAGGAGIAFSLLFLEYVSCIHLNDLNKSVYAFWCSVIYETDALCAKIESTPVNMPEWFNQQEIQNNPQVHTRLELGFSTFFLNRTNRSGILKGGVIGGKGQTGEWKLDARFNKKDLIQRIQKIAHYSNRIHLYNLDAADLITTVLPSLPAKTLVYLDPPYYVKGKDLYEDHYSHKDHEWVAKLVQKKIKQHWVVSYDNAPAIKGMYPKRRSIIYGINYSAATRYTGAEIMFFSDKLIIPDINHLANLKAN